MCVFVLEDGRQNGIREHILTVKSMKDAGNDEWRQDNSKVENMEREDPRTADGRMTAQPV